MATSNKIDLKKERNDLYAPPAKAITVVEVPPLNFLMIDGQGDPNTSPEFQAAMETLFSVSYTLKFSLKKGAQPVDYAVMPVEGLWWSDNMDDFLNGDKSNWSWTVMIAQPDLITAQMAADATAQVTKKRGDSPALHKLRFCQFDEGLSAQIMYLGPFANEGPAIADLHHFIEENQYELNGKHHEIYLSDFRRTAPEKLKTVLRQPIRRKTPQFQAS